jgi:ABC-type transporter Mla maintaining outer membrane lipid asymmetry ATPase subunit MlaF
MSLLEVRGLKRIVSDSIVLTDINLSVKRGEVLFVRGPSGVGKSLLLRAIALLDEAQVKKGCLAETRADAGRAPARGRPCSSSQRCCRQRSSHA